MSESCRNPVLEVADVPIRDCTHEMYTKFDLSNYSHFAISTNIYSLYLPFVSFQLEKKTLNEVRGGPAAAGAGRVPQTTTATTATTEAGPTNDPTRAG